MNDHKKEIDNKCVLLIILCHSMRIKDTISNQPNRHVKLEQENGQRLTKAFLITDKSIYNEYRGIKRWRLVLVTEEP